MENNKSQAMEEYESKKDLEGSKGLLAFLSL